MKPDRTGFLQFMADSAIEQALAERPLLVLPLGAVESHGEHLPAGTDNVLAERMTEAFMARIAGVVPALALPCMPFGQIFSLADAPGSFGIGTETVATAIVEIARSARTKGVPAMVVLNAHLGNAEPIRLAQRRLKDDGFPLANFFYPGFQSHARAIRETAEARAGYIHACEIETSFALYLAPDMVSMEAGEANYPDFPADFDVLAYRWTEFSESPVLGDPRAASAEKGRQIIEPVLDRMVDLARTLHARAIES